jgi:hypothetical protein
MRRETTRSNLDDSDNEIGLGLCPALRHSPSMECRSIDLAIQATGSKAKITLFVALI